MKTLILSALFCALASDAIACSAPTYGAKFTKTIPAKPDQKLFTEALLLATNFERCKVNKAALGTHATLRKAASIHSRNMAKPKYSATHPALETPVP